VPLGEAVTALGLILRPDQDIVGLATDARENHRTAGIFVVHRDYLLKIENGVLFYHKFWKKQDPSESDGSEMVVIGEMLHDILDAAVQNVAKTVDGVDLHVPVLAEPVQLGAVDVVVGIEVVLGHAALLHCFPKPIIFDHTSTSK
jgi:hypothetical protein